jgi:hypothetical protein
VSIAGEAPADRYAGKLSRERRERRQIRTGILID